MVRGPRGCVGAIGQLPGEGGAMERPMKKLLH